MRERRALLIAEHRPDDLRSWVACLVRWMLEPSELDGSYFQSFVAMLYQYGRRDAFTLVPVDFLLAMRADHEQLASYLGHIDEPLRAHRIQQARVLIVHAAADRERARATGQVVLPFAVALGDLVDAMVGFLEAPVSAASRTALERADPASMTWRALL
jgi:hypothetical protein